MPSVPTTGIRVEREPIERRGEHLQSREIKGDQGRSMEIVPGIRVEQRASRLSSHCEYSVRSIEVVQ
jgi:hypothetical protein